MDELWSLPHIEPQANGESLEDLERASESIRLAFRAFSARQQPLGAEFSKVWDDNLSELYET